MNFFWVGLCNLAGQRHLFINTLEKIFEANLHSVREAFVGVAKCTAIPAPFREINLLKSPQNMTALWEDYDFFFVFLSAKELENKTV